LIASSEDTGFGIRKVSGAKSEEEDDGESDFLCSEECLPEREEGEEASDGEDGDEWENKNREKNPSHREEEENERKNNNPAPECEKGVTFDERDDALVHRRYGS
jgi:hypothetical protein